MTFLRPTHLSGRSPIGTPTAEAARAGQAGAGDAQQSLVAVAKSHTPHIQRLTGAAVRAMSPRQMAALSWDLYIAGLLAEDEYILLAFQPDFHPRYEDTIGALTGKKAAPDEPRDYLHLWEERLAFERNYGSTRPEIAARIERILRVLRAIDELSNRYRTQ